MKTTDYRMVTFKGELVEVAEKFNTWMRKNDNVEVIDIKFAPLTFDTYANEFALVVLYRVEVEKTSSDNCKLRPVIERPTPTPEELETLKVIQHNMAEISHAIEFGSCSRCWSGIQGLNRDMATLMNMLGWNYDKEDKND